MVEEVKEKFAGIHSRPVSEFLDHHTKASPISWTGLFPSAGKDHDAPCTLTRQSEVALRRGGGGLRLRRRRGRLAPGSSRQARCRAGTRPRVRDGRVPRQVLRHAPGDAGQRQALWCRPGYGIVRCARGRGHACAGGMRARRRIAHQCRRGAQARRPRVCRRCLAGPDRTGRVAGGRLRASAGLAASGALRTRGRADQVSRAAQRRAWRSALRLSCPRLW